MKKDFKKWNNFINERKELIREFNRKDKEEIMSVADNFSISYEIELESYERINAGEDDFGSRLLDAAASYLSDDYFTEMAEQMTADDFLEETLKIDDLEEFMKRYLTEHDDMPVESTWAAIFELAATISPAYKDKILKPFKGLDDNVIVASKFAVILNKLMGPDSVKHLLGRNFEFAEQGRLKGIVPDGEKTTLILTSDISDVGRLVKEYIFDYRASDNLFMPNKASLSPVTAMDLLQELTSPETVDDIYDFVSNSFFKTFFGDERIEYLTFEDIASATVSDSYDNTIVAEILEYIQGEARQRVEDAAEGEADEYADDPVSYLADMGVDEESYAFDLFDGSSAYGDPRALLAEHLPNFMREYEDKLKFEDDQSLQNGVEFSMDNPMYMTGIDEAFRFLELFFSDLNKQNNFRMDRRTGLHTNIGYLKDGKPVGSYNVTKALLALNHDFAMKGFENRKGSRWASDIKEVILKSLGQGFAESRPSTLKDTVEKLKNHPNLPRALRDIDLQVQNLVPYNPKAFGFNIAYIDDRKYIEFRYPGGTEPTLEKMKEATLYYCHLVRQAADPEYKKREYYKKFIGLINNLSPENLKGPTKNLKEAVKILDKGVIYSFNNEGGEDRGPGPNMLQVIKALNPSTKEIENIKERLFKAIRQVDSNSRFLKIFLNTHLFRYVGVEKGAERWRRLHFEILVEYPELKKKKYTRLPSVLLDEVANGAFKNADNRFEDIYKSEPSVRSVLDEAGISPSDLRVLFRDLFRQASANSKKGED